MAVSFEYIDHDAALRDAVEACAGHEVLTVDTEFARTDTYYPQVGLVQLYDGDECFLIDPLAADVQLLAPLLVNPGVLNVLHACSEDLEVFHFAVGDLPTPVFDTQIAAAVLGAGFSMGYQALVEHYLGIEVPKEQTRSNWLRRPLSRAQLDYAALDVIYLYDVYERIIEDLDRTGRSEWVAEECARLGQEIAIDIDPQQSYLRVKSAARMKPRELNVLQALCAWREITARRLDVPRNRVLDERALVNLARTPKQSLEALQQAGMSPRQVRKHGEAILACLAAADDVAREHWPALTIDSTAVSNQQLKLLKQVVNAQAEQVGIAPEMLARRRQLEELLRTGNDGDYHLPASLGGWRQPLIGDALLAALRKESR